MKSISYFFVGLFIPLLLSCNGDTISFQRKNSIYRIVFAQGGCYGPCPSETFSIDSSLRVKYQGVQNVSDSGYYTSMISKDLWDQINNRCEQINYHQLDSSYTGWIDAQLYELFIYDSLGVKRIEYCFHGAEQADSLIEFGEWIRNVALASKLKPSPDTFVFETKYHLPPPMNKDTVFLFIEPETN